MKKNHIKKGTTRPSWLSVVIGVTVSAVMLILLSAFSAWLIVNEHLQEETAGAAAVIIQCVSAFLGCLLTAILVRERKAIYIAASAAAYAICLICFNILFLDGTMDKLWPGVLSITTGAAICAALQLVGHGKGVKRKKYKIR